VADIEGLAEVQVAAHIVPAQAVGLPDIRVGGADGYSGAVMLESIQNDCRVLRHYLQALFLVDSVAERNFAGNNSAMLYLAVQNNADSFPAQVRFVLRNGEAEVDIQPPACRGGVVLLLGGQPTAFVAFKISMTL